VFRLANRSELPLTVRFAQPSIAIGSGAKIALLRLNGMRTPLRAEHV